MSDAVATDSQYTSNFAASFLDVLRKATVDAGMSWTEAELISARDYTFVSFVSLQEWRGNGQCGEVCY